MHPQTSGTELVDTLVDGVHVGDNLILQADTATPLALLVDRFLTRARGEVPLVLVRVAAPWDGPVPDGMHVLDWSAAVTGSVASHPHALPPGADVAAALAMLRDVDEQVGAGAAFVVDDLAAVQSAWGRAAALELFLATCPRLYRRRSLAVWPLRTDRLPPSLLRRLAEITQVVVEVVDEDDGLRVTVRKADGRDPAVVGRSVRATIVDGDLVAAGPATSTRELLGTAIRDQRLARGLSQAEVARRVGITPSALSQVERGVRGPGGDTLVRLWEVLGVPFGPAGPSGGDARYHIARRSRREQVRLQDGVTGERVVDDRAAGQVWTLEFAAGATGTAGPFATKRAESALLVRGVLDVTVDGRAETLHEGDALVLHDASVTAWSNPGPEAARAVWTLHG